jgi:hypothetical protein
MPVNLDGAKQNELRTTIHTTFFFMAELACSIIPRLGCIESLLDSREDPRHVPKALAHVW